MCIRFHKVESMSRAPDLGPVCRVHLTRADDTFSSHSLGTRPIRKKIKGNSVASCYDLLRVGTEVKVQIYTVLSSLFLCMYIYCFCFVLFVCCSMTINRTGVEYYA